MNTHTVYKTFDADGNQVRPELGLTSRQHPSTAALMELQSRRVDPPPEIIKVRSTLPKDARGGDPVALFERHIDHPGVEVFVAGDQVVEVAKTPRVRELLFQGTLAEVRQ